VVRIRASDFVSIFAEIPEVRSQIPVLRKKILDAVTKFAPELRDFQENSGRVLTLLVRQVWSLHLMRE